MKLAMVGLGKMGANMARRLRNQGIDVVGYDRERATVDELARTTGAEAAEDLADVVRRLPAPRCVWLMLPAGAPTEDTLTALTEHLSEGDVVVDGGNANYHDTQRRAAALRERGIELVDAGTSGGVWGLDNGYCLMVGGSEPAIAALRPALEALAPAPDRGWAHVGPVGSGHFVKMVHNGIEYGLMQAYAEGMNLLHNKREFELDLAQITELWRHGSVVRSWLLDLTADALGRNVDLDRYSASVSDSGEGRWTVLEAVEQGTAIPVIASALQARFTSQDEYGYGNRLLSLMRNAFGGHTVHVPDASTTPTGKQ